MKLWDELVRVALVGTERVPLALPPAPGALAPLLDEAAKGPREDALLACAAYVSGWQVAGALPPAPDTLSAAPAAIEGDRPEATPREASLLRAMVAEAPSALTEAFRTLERRGRRVPLALLPELFALAARSRDLRPPLAAAMGAHGAWLAAQRADWRFMLGEVATLDASAWDGDRAQRAIYLRTLREHDAAKARDLVAGCWKAEPAASRRDFLATFEVGLAAADEAFLEAALDDRSKEVRATAADLLGRLAGSAFQGRMAARARARVRIDGKPLGEAPPAATGFLGKLAQRALGAVGAGRTVDFEPPSELSAEDKRDGLESESKQEGKGWRAAALKEIASSTPLDLWTEATGLGIDDFLKAARKSDWRAPLLDGLRAAALAQERADWAEALFASVGMEKILEHELGPIVRLLPPALLSSAAVAAKMSHRSIVFGTEIPAPWPLPMTEALATQAFGVARSVPYWEHWNAALILLVAERGAIAYHAEFAKAATELLQKDTEYRKSLDEALRTYQLRHEFHEEPLP